MFKFWFMAAVCMMASPAPSENNPRRKSPYTRVIAAGTNRKAPAAMNQNPNMMPFLNPTRFNK